MTPAQEGEDSPSPRSTGPGAPAPHDVPTAAELIEAVREFLTSDVVPATEGRVKFHTRVAANVLAMVEREMALGPEQAEAHAGRLQTLGYATDGELAVAIRSGTLDDRWTEVKRSVWESVQDKLAVANPTYAEEPPD